jgi:putative hemolysin
VEFAFFILILGLLTLCSAYFSASETALFSLSSMKVKAYQTDPNPRKRLIAQLVLHPRDLLVTVFMLNTLVNILIQNVSSSMFGLDATWQLKIGFPLFIMLFFGEIFPKFYGLQNNLKLSYYFAPSIFLLQKLLKPIQKWIIALTSPISNLMFFFLKKEQSISREELKHVLKTSEAHGVLHSDEAELVWGYLNLQDMLVKELMCPRGDMECYDIEEPLSKLIYLFTEKKHSRIPVYDRILENIIGIISAKQFFLHQNEIKCSSDLKRWLTKPLYVPENVPARMLLRRLDKQGQELAVVIEEYGSISGLITREDIFEVVIGKSSISQESEIQYTQTGQNEIIANGKLELSAFNEIFKSNLKSPANRLTLGGWLIERLDEIPKIGTKYKTNEFFFHILSADSTRIKKVYVRKLTKSNSNSKNKKNKNL